MSGGGSFKTGENGFNLRLPGDPEAAATARRALGHLRDDLGEPLMETMRLLVTELVANSVRHAQARFVSVRAVITGSSVWLEVSDEGPGFEVEGAMRRGTQQEESGWGLFLVERLAKRWGVRREGDATHVWFELQR
ncbi:MAG TPA: ATP-binding protein [Thermoleophilaceae bacterium]|jgi:anti-sigma regulatory factor (Ser/Thr protein kinase)